MSKVCSSHNLAGLEQIMNDFDLRMYAFELLVAQDENDIKAHENEWFGLLYEVFELFKDSRERLKLFESHLRSERDMPR